MDGLALKIEPVLTNGMRRLTSHCQKEEQKRRLDKKIPDKHCNESFGLAHDIAPTRHAKFRQTPPIIVDENAGALSLHRLFMVGRSQFA
jgi:hypothetical protein